MNTLYTSLDKFALIKEGNLQMRRCSNSYNSIRVSQVWSALYVMRESSVKFGLYPVHMQAITQNEEWICIRLIFIIKQTRCTNFSNLFVQ